MKDKIVITSVGFNPPYLEQLDRQLSSIKDVYGDEVDVIHWRDELPPGSRDFLDSLYGFKPHAVAYAKAKGYEKIVFVDPAVYLTAKIDYLFEFGLPVIAVKDSSLLKDNTICYKAFRYYNAPVMMKDDSSHWHLCGGSLYCFDYRHPDCEKIFNHWAKAEADGIFGSQWEQSNEKINGHRNDESCMSMALYMNGYEPVSNIEAGYNLAEGSPLQKKHFK